MPWAVIVKKKTNKIIDLCQNYSHVNTKKSSIFTWNSILRTSFLSNSLNDTTQISSLQGCQWLSLGYKTIHRNRFTEKVQNFSLTYRTVYRTIMEIYRNNTDLPINLQNRLQNKIEDLTKKYRLYNCCWQLETNNHKIIFL